jgi:hypothetical protein
LLAVYFARSFKARLRHAVMAAMIRWWEFCRARLEEPLLIVR